MEISKEQKLRTRANNLAYALLGTLAGFPIVFFGTHACMKDIYRTDLGATRIQIQSGIQHQLAEKTAEFLKKAPNQEERQRDLEYALSVEETIYENCFPKNK